MQTKPVCKIPFWIAVTLLSAFSLSADSITFSLLPRAATSRAHQVLSWAGDTRLLTTAPLIGFSPVLSTPIPFQTVRLHHYSIFRILAPAKP